MTLTWRHDGIATALVAGTIALYGTYELGSPVPGFGAVRTISAAALVLGIGACAAAGGASGTSNAWQTFVAWLGVVAFGLLVTGMARGSGLALRLAVAEIAGLWVVATGRRLAARPAVAKERAEPRDLVGGRR